MLRACAAIHPDNVDRKGFESGQCCPDLSPVQHRAEGFDGHLCDHRNSHLAFFEKIEDRRKSCLGLQKVLTGLDNKDVGTAVVQSADLFDISLFQIAVGDVSKCRQLCSRPDRARNETRFARSRIIACKPLCKLGRFFVDVICLFDNAKFSEHDLAAAKAVGLDDVAADIQKAGVHLFDRVGPRIKQIFGAVLEIRPAPIVDGQIQRLQIAAHRAVENYDPLFQ